MSLQLWPLSVVFARLPCAPVAKATDGLVADSRVNGPWMPPPTGENVAPASFDTTVVPFSPTATARVGDANPAANTLRLEGETSTPVAPPSIVRISRVPSAVPIRHVAAVQEIERSVEAVAPASG